MSTSTVSKSKPFLSANREVLEGSGGEGAAVAAEGGAGASVHRVVPLLKAWGEVRAADILKRDDNGAYYIEADG